MFASTLNREKDSLGLIIYVKLGASAMTSVCKDNGVNSCGSRPCKRASEAPEIKAAQSISINVGSR